MGLFRKKKKKERKPWTVERFTKLFLPVMFIGIVAFSIMGGGFACDNPFDAYGPMLEELNEPFDVNDIIGSNIVLASDKQTLKEKLGSGGAEINIILDGEIRAELYNDSVTLIASRDISLRCEEMAQFTNIILNYSGSDIKIEILEIGIEQDTDKFKLEMIYYIDISALTSDLNNGLSEIKKIYIKANADMLLQDNEAQIISATSQANALSEKSNTELIKLVNTLTGSKYDIGSEKFASMINDFAQKLSANISISNNLITFDI